MTEPTQTAALGALEAPSDQPGSVTGAGLDPGRQPIRSHASGTRGITLLPTSSFHTGKFGRMFRNLPGYNPPNDVLRAIADAMVEPDPEEGEETEPESPVAPTSGWAGGAAAPAEGQPDEHPPDPDLDNAAIPAGYTYLGQFLDHDVTFDPASSLSRRADPDSLHDFRTPRLDLDSVYGRGLSDQPYLYDQRAGREGFLAVDQHDGLLDLPRVNDRQAATAEGRVPYRAALIGDPRNDENILVAQMHVTFIMFHNRLLEELVGGGWAEHLQSNAAVDRFAEAQRIVRWHYQYLILTDFLCRTVGEELRNQVVSRRPSPLGGADVQAVTTEFYNPHDGDPFMPVEFSVAAYRFGHSQIRRRYRLNTVVRDVEIFVETPSDANQLKHLGGHRAFPPFWQIEWSRFFPVAGSDENRVQSSRRLDTKLARPLANLPGDIATTKRSLAERNLLRGKMLGLPSGQAVARRMGAQVLSPDDLELPGHATPLWAYVLGEADRLGGGAHLGPVGGRIVAEVLAGLVRHDPFSFLRVEPGWIPFLGPRPGTFEMKDLLSYVGFGLTDVVVP